MSHSRSNGVTHQRYRKMRGGGAVTSVSKIGVEQQRDFIDDSSDE